LRHELDWIANDRGAHVYYLTGARRPGRRDPLSPQSLQKLVPDLRHNDVFVCGPDGMAAAARASLREAHVPRRHIHSESFTF